MFIWVSLSHSRSPLKKGSIRRCSPAIAKLLRGFKSIYIHFIVIRVHRCIALSFLTWLHEYLSCFCVENKPQTQPCTFFSLKIWALLLPLYRIKHFKPVLLLRPASQALPGRREKKLYWERFFFSVSWKRPPASIRKKWFSVCKPSSWCYWQKQGTGLNSSWADLLLKPTSLAQALLQTPYPPDVPLTHNTSFLPRTRICRRLVELYSEENADRFSGRKQQYIYTNDK